MGNLGISSVAALGGTLALSKIIPAILILIVCFIAIKVVLSLLQKIMLRTSVDPTLSRFAFSTAKILLYFVAVLIV